MVGKFSTMAVMVEPETIATRIADMLLIPCRASGDDEHAVETHLAPLLSEIRQERGTLPATFIVPAFTHPRTASARVAEYFTGWIPGVECLDAPLTSRTVHEDCGRAGLTLREYTASVKGNARAHTAARHAVEDVERIAKEILRHDNQRP